MVCIYRANRLAKKAMSMVRRGIPHHGIFRVFFTNIGLWKSRGQLYDFIQRFAMVETKLRLATNTPPDLTKKPVRSSDITGFFVAA